MAIMKLSLVMAFCFATLASASNIQDKKATPNRALPQTSKSGLARSRNLVISTIIDKHPSKGGVILKWSLKNISEKDIAFRDTNIFLDYRITVKNQHNRPVRLTEKGQRAFTASYFTTHKAQVTLRSGEEITKQIEITDFYDMKPRGEYTILVERQLFAVDNRVIETIRSNVVKVRIGS